MGWGQVRLATKYSINFHHTVIFLGKQGPPCTRTLLQLHVDRRVGFRFLALLPGSPLPNSPTCCMMRSWSFVKNTFTAEWPPNTRPGRKASEDCGLSRVQSGARRLTQLPHRLYSKAPVSARMKTRTLTWQTASLCTCERGDSKDPDTSRDSQSTSTSAVVCFPRVKYDAQSSAG